MFVCLHIAGYWLQNQEPGTILLLGVWLGRLLIIYLLYGVVGVSVQHCLFFSATTRFLPAKS